MLHVFTKSVLCQLLHLSLRELDGSGHLLTVFISCTRRALYKNVGKYANLKAEILEIFFTK